MQPLQETISVRVERINSQLVGKGSKCTNSNLITRDGLLDALQVLYDECNSDYLKRSDKNVQKFVEKYRDLIQDLNQLRVNISDFEIKDVIGRGHFGEVHVVKEKQTGDVYAMKTIKKCDGAGRKRTSFEEERNIMVLTQSPWLTSLQYSFQDDTCLFYVMEYHPGGDLLGLLYRQGGSIPESAATFYIAELIMALQDLHQMGFVHRDIKPDNVLLDRCGHIKLADFGSAAKLNAQGVVEEGLPVGTPDYIAPEVLQSMDTRSTKKTLYGISCDYWSVGILAYELTIGNTPFTGHSTTMIYSKIMKHADNLKFPPEVLLTQAYISFIKGLITEQKTRLNHGQILKHPLFKNTDFNGLRDLVPPFVPKISTPEDTSNFSDIPTKRTEPNMQDYKRKMHFSARNLPYIGFTYTMDREEEAPCSFSKRTSIKDEALQTLKEEINALKRKVLKGESAVEEKDSLERKLEEKCRKLDNVEKLRDKLEHDLAKNMSECLVLKRTLDMERKDRVEVEKKALDMIRSAKLKWDNAEKTKIAELTLELDQQREKITQLSATNEILNEQLQHALQLENKHRTATLNVEKLRRSSVMGLESRLDRMTVESQSQLSELRKRLSQEVNLRTSLEKQVDSFKRNTTSLVSKLEVQEEDYCNQKRRFEEAQKRMKEMENKIMRLEVENKNLVSYKEEVEELRLRVEARRSDATIFELEKCLGTEKDKVLTLSGQVEDLKSEIQRINTTNTTIEELLEQKSAWECDLADQKESYERRIDGLETEIRGFVEEKESLAASFDEAKRREEVNKYKVRTLEELLSRLESGVAKLESGGEREAVLQEQVERLEQQLVQVHESAAVEKQELAQLKTKFWRLQKDLENSLIDKRILERELKELQQQNKQIKVEYDNLVTKMEDNKKSYESALLELNNLNENLTGEVYKLTDAVQGLKDRLDFEKEKCDGEKSYVSELKGELQAKEAQIRDLFREIEGLRVQKQQVCVEYDQCLSEIGLLRNSLEATKRENEDLRSELDNCKRDAENTQLNLNALREACTVLENQLIEYEKLQESFETKQISLNANTEKLINDLAKAAADIQEARRQTNEEKSLRLLAETKCKRLAEDVECLEKECKSYKEQCVEFKQYSNGLSDELSVAEERIADLEVSLRSSDRRVEEFVAENSLLKEENSAQLTHLLGVKETNYKLNHQLGESKENNEQLRQRIKELEDLLKEEVRFYKDREIKSTATIQQQTKLIDYLQSKIEEHNSKKKTFTERLFSHSKKENQPPNLVVLNYKDLESQLQKERQLNAGLREEIFRLKAENHFAEAVTCKNADVDDIRTLEQLVQSPADLSRQNSTQRMHHNIPHRFEAKTAKKSTKCALCAEQIASGKSSDVCKECGLVVHNSCAKSVPRTCGLPRAYARHYSDSLTRLGKDRNRSQVGEGDDDRSFVEVEGWIKIPSKNRSWEKRYAKLTTQTLKIYERQPEDDDLPPVVSLELKPKGGYGRVILEPTETEIPVTKSDLPFVIKVEVGPTSTTWPPKHVVFMVLSVADKEKWFKALQGVFQETDERHGETVAVLKDGVHVNCTIKVSPKTLLCGTEDGLYSYHDGTWVHIAGPLQIYEIVFIRSVNVAVMIADTRRVLITCDLNHLMSLAQCASCARPTLKFTEIEISKLSGFQILKASDSDRYTMLCTATAKQFVILNYDVDGASFVPSRVLDTAQPASCILFTELTVIVGVDKFFEIDLETFKAEEFLDESDDNLQRIVRKARKMGSFPRFIARVSADPVEYVACFADFAVFVDEFGSCTRKFEIKYNRLPNDFYFSAPYLYVVQLDSVEIVKITSETCNLSKEGDISKESFDSWSVGLNGPRLLGSDGNGVLLAVDKEIRLVKGRRVDDDDEFTTDTNISNDLDSDRFSFTSSIVHSLDGNLSDADSGLVEESCAKGKVKFQTAV